MSVLLFGRVIGGYSMFTGKRGEGRVDKKTNRETLKLEGFQIKAGRRDLYML